LKISEPPAGSLGFEPYSDTITLDGINLNPDDIYFTASSGLLFAAVYIGNFLVEFGVHTLTPHPDGKNSFGVGLYIPHDHHTERYHISVARCRPGSMIL
jgi:hypothetical protein